MPELLFAVGDFGEGGFAALPNHQMRQRLGKMGVKGTEFTPESFARSVKSERSKFADIVKSARITVE